MELESDRMRLLLDPEEFASEISVIREEAAPNLREDPPFGLLSGGGGSDDVHGSTPITGRSSDG
ncbi:MAG: hypothetical protein R3E12_11835 [Candidatus Eisenbacteria bacterium]